MRFFTTTKKRGFTLIELLVVVSIIALLVSILMPALGKARKQARRVICSTHLHQYSLALFAYMVDNDKIPETGTVWGKNGRFPNVVMSEVLLNDDDKKKWISIEKMEPYLQGINLETKTMGDNTVWYCPSFRKNTDFMTQLWQNYDYFHSAYSYFAGVNNWPDSAMSDPVRMRKELVGNKLTAAMLLMSDQIQVLNIPVPAGAGWQYNHGKNGPSQVEAYWPGIQVDAGPPAITGTNQMFGDGHVEWKGEIDFDVSLMQAGSTTLPWVLPAGGFGLAMFTY